MVFMTKNLRWQMRGGEDKISLRFESDSIGFFYPTYRGEKRTFEIDLSFIYIRGEERREVHLEEIVKMNNGFGSECSSRCESGWTMYLDHSSGSPSKRSGDGGGGGQGGGYINEDGYDCVKGMDEDEEEDMSMVSDASSGPQNGCFCSVSSSASTVVAKKRIKRQIIKKPPPPPQQQQQEHHSLLDDTASSTFFSLSKNNNNFNHNNQQASRESVLDYSQGFSATHFESQRSSPFPTQFGFLDSSLPGKQTSAKPVDCRKSSGNQIW